MGIFRRHRRTHHTWPYIVFGLILFLVIFRALLPSLMTSFANSRLKKESPYFAFHIRDIDLHILRGKYVVEGITGTIKDNEEEFLHIDSVESSLPWKNIFKGEPLANVVVNKMDVKASQVLLDNAKLEAKRVKEKLEKEEDKDKDKESPVNVNSFALRDSRIIIHDFMSFKGKETRTVDNINVFAKNLTPKGKKEATDFSMTADVFGPAPLSVVGKAMTKAEPLGWDMNAVLKEFELKSINPVMEEKVKSYFEDGKLDLYTEVKSEKETIEGYLKPFVSKLKMDQPEQGIVFKGSASENGGKLLKVLLTNSGEETIATEIPFKYENKKLDLDVIDVLKKAIAHKTKKDVKPGIEDNIGQKGLGLKESKQAQEAR